MKKVAKALTKRKPEKEDKGKLETSVHYHTRSPTRPPPSTPSASKRPPCIHSTPIARIDFSSLEETIDSSPEVDPEVSFKPTHQSDLSSETEDDTSSEASELLRNAQLSWDDSSHAGEMDQQQEGVAYAEPTPDDNQQPTATSSNTAENPPTVTLEMLMQVLQEDNKAMRAEVTEKIDKQNEKMDKQNQDLKDLALKLDQQSEYCRRANQELRDELITRIDQQAKDNQETTEQLKVNQERLQVEFANNQEKLKNEIKDNQDILKADLTQQISEQREECKRVNQENAETNRKSIFEMTSQLRTGQAELHSQWQEFQTESQAQQKKFSEEIQGQVQDHGRRVAQVKTFTEGIHGLVQEQGKQ